MSDKTFEDLRNPENEVSRTFDLQRAEKVFHQIEVPGSKGRFMQMEYHKPNCGFAFAQDDYEDSDDDSV